MSRALLRDGVVTLTAAMIGLAITLLVLDRRIAQLKSTQRAIGVVDIAELVREEDERIAALLTRMATDRNRESAERESTTHARESAARAASFAQRLDVAIRELPERCRCTVLNAAAVLGGNVKDLTPLVRERVQP